MSANLMPWLVAWVIVTIGVLVLLVWRMVVAKDERGGIRIAEGEQRDLALQVRIAPILKRIDLCGKTLTVVSAMLALIVGSLWLYNGWLIKR